MFQAIDYGRSSTEALAKEAVSLQESYEDVKACLSKLGCHPDKSIVGKLDALYEYLIETHNSVIIVLFDRFVNMFGFREYYEEHPCEDWLDNSQFINWYEAIAADTSSSEKLHTTMQIAKYWAEGLNKENDE